MCPINARQIRGARAMLGWSILHLATLARVSVSSVKRAEDAQVKEVSTRILQTIRETMEDSGVQFLDDDGDGPGLRLRAR